MGVADFVARGTGAFASRFSCTLDETTVGGKILPPWEALDIMHFVEQHEAEDLADTWDRLQQIQRVGVMVLGGFDDAEFDVAKQSIVVADESEINFNTFLDRRISKTLGDSVTVGFVGDLFANGGQVISPFAVQKVQKLNFQGDVSFRSTRL